MTMKKVRTDDLEKVFNRIIAKLRDEQVVEVDLDEDLYRFIPADKWSRFDDETIEQGSLYDDLESLELLVRNEDRPCTYVDFDRVASLLRAISQKMNPV
jgi:hypothetical protein